MKRIYQLSMIVLLITISSIIIQSCCTENFKIIGKGNIGAYYDYFNERNRTDTVDRAISIHWHLEYRIASLNDFGLIRSCYATSCAEAFDNELIESTLEISCDKDFEYNGNTIDHDSNFIGIDELELFFIKTYGSVEIVFTEDFLNKTNFDASDYVFTVKIHTTDEKEFIHSLRLHMDL